MFLAISPSLPASLASQTVPASSFKGTDFQTWDELDAMTRLTSHLDVTWIARVRLSTNLPNPAHYVFGTFGILAPQRTWCLRRPTTTARIARRRELSGIDTFPCYRSRPYSREEGGPCPTGTVSEDGLTPLRDHHGFIGIVLSSITTSVLRTGRRQCLRVTKSTTCPNIKVGQGTEWRPVRIRCWGTLRLRSLLRARRQPGRNAPTYQYDRALD